MALGSIQPLTKMSTGNLPRGNGRQARKADNFTTILRADSLDNVGLSTSHNPMGLPWPLTGIALPLHLMFICGQYTMYVL
jgi:hypothetical protein